MIDHRFQHSVDSAKTHLDLDPKELPLLRALIDEFAGTINRIDPTYKVGWVAMMHILSSSVADWAVRRSGAETREQKCMKAITAFAALYQNGMANINQLCSKPDDKNQVN